MKNINIFFFNNFLFSVFCFLFSVFFFSCFSFPRYKWQMYNIEFMKLKGACDDVSFEEECDLFYFWETHRTNQKYIDLLVSNILHISINFFSMGYSFYKNTVLSIQQLIVQLLREIVINRYSQIIDYFLYFTIK